MNRRSTRLARLLLLAATLTIPACRDATGPELEDVDGDGTSDEEEASIYGRGVAGTIADALAANVPVHDVTADLVWSESSVVGISLNGSSISAGTGASVSGSTVTITAPGTYRLSGQLGDGRVVVDSDSPGVVRLLLAGVSIRSSTSAPIEIVDAERALIVLVAGTSNQLSDGNAYVLPSGEDEPNATLFSKVDLTLAGEGALTVRGSYNDGIASKDGLVIAGGDITVQALDDALRGKDYVVVRGGRLSLTAGGDGIKADNEDNLGAGWVYFAGGSVGITAGGDAVDAATDVLLGAGTLTLTAGGGATRTVAADASAKGLKADVQLIAEGGSATIDAADDALHANAHVVIRGGQYALATADDGVHADSTLTFADGSLELARSYEGFESRAIVVSGGTVRLTTSDDGVNAAGDATGGRGGGAGQGANSVRIAGGWLIVEAGGDGIDANGSITMSDGFVVVNGPTVNNNAAIDYDGSFQLTGGFLVAAGSSGMAQTAGANSTQPALLLSTTTAKAAGTVVRIESSSGADVLTFAPTKRYQTVAFSSPALQSGASYRVFVGGASTGTRDASGVYQGGTYSGGTAAAQFTLSAVVSRITF